VHRLKLIGGWSLLLAVLAFASALAAEPSVSGRVVGPDGKGIAGAVVFVQSAVDTTSSRSAPVRAQMDQMDKTFVPGVLPIVAGTEVRFPNHDQIHHHVYSFSRTKSFELPLYKGQEAPPVLFDKPGVVKIGCNIHDWMSAVILVLPTRHYTVTDTQGRFVLSDLPAGEHTLAAWHELSRTKLEETLQPVQIAARSANATNGAEITFTLSLAPARTRPAIRGSRRDT
jgi:plastocyanin